MKILRSDQIKETDEFTIKNEPISSVDLMERAAGQVFKWIRERFGQSRHFFIFAGPGNNGGDGIALARMLALSQYNVELHYLKFTEKTTGDWEINRQRLENETSVRFRNLTGPERFPVISSGDVIIDAIFGSGLTRPVKGPAAEIIRLINDSDATRISIDIPSGLFGEDNSGNSPDTIIKADYTLCFQMPRLSFMFAENFSFTGQWTALPIGLDQKAIIRAVSPYTLLETNEIAPLIRKRGKFDHKGIYGHGLLISGSSGKMGAAVLGASAALRTGIGLITCYIPSGGRIILQSSLPEAMVVSDRSEEFISEAPDTGIYSAVGIGPGIGTGIATQKALQKLLSVCRKPMVIDADALNILSLNEDMLSNLPEGTILTPHPKEFERIAGKTENGFMRMTRQIGFSARYRCYVVLKGAHTSITTPDGKVFFNSTGNPGMATAGSGDALTGIILSLLAQGYTPEHAAIFGVFLHGSAGDAAAGESCYESVIASDIVNSIGKAYNMIRQVEL
jgi:ADP-dependent NAD(P)H-hydrate dehydratase / NAD(P)H-hydrate epimerase